MLFVLSRYNHDISWVKDYTDDVVLYDRSEEKISNSIPTPNIGSDLYDKFTYIKDNTTFTPLLTQNHKTYLPICWYENGLYAEINDYWYLGSHPAKHTKEIMDIFKMNERYYNLFAPGSNYIIPKENILKHPKEFYEKLRSFLEWDVYPGDAQILERNLFYLWNNPLSPQKN